MRPQRLPLLLYWAAMGVSELKTSIMNRQWMCGFPDTLIIVQVGADCVVSAFGNAELIEYFKTQLCAAYGCSVLVEESLA